MYNPGWHLARDLKNMVLVSQVIAQSALLRKESRGAHSRLDHPKLDPEFAKVNHCARHKHGKLSVEPTPLATMPAELAALFEEPAATKA